MKMSNNTPKARYAQIDEKTKELDELLEIELDLEKIGEILKTEIQNSDYTQEEIGTILHMDRKTINAYCSGNEYTVTSLLKFSKLFGCSMDYLMGVSPCRNIEYHSIGEEIGLMDGSIDRLVSAQKAHQLELKLVYDYLIQNDGLVSALKNYIHLHLTPEDELSSSKLTDPITGEPIHILKIGGVPMNVPDLKMIYANNAILALFDRLEDYAENKQWKFMKNGLLE